MIRKAFLTLLSLSCASLLFAAPADTSKKLDRLWSRYRKAEKLDLPQEEESILLKIKHISKESGDAASFYKAASLYVDVCSARNWKQRDELRKALDTEVESFGNSLMSFRHKWSYPYSEQAFRYILDNSEALKGNLTRGLYPELPESLADNDLEYAIWACVKAGNRSALNCADLMSMIGGEEMKSLALRLELILRSTDRKELKGRLEEFCSGCPDPLVNLLTQEQILKLDFYAMEQKEKKNEQDYLALKQKLKQLVSRAATLVKKGKTPSLNGDGEGILRRLEDKELRAEVKNDTLNVYLRNLQGVKIEISRKGKKEMEKSLNLERKKFYLIDTLTLNLSSLEDADWDINLKSGILTSTLTYPKRSLSLALRRDSDGIRVYVADYRSGKGLDDYSLQVRSTEGKLMGTYFIKGEGFVEIGSQAEQQLSQKGNWAVAEDYIIKERRTLLSPKCRLPYSYPSEETGSPSLQAQILTDRKAYRMGETLLYKAIIYSGFQTQRPAPEHTQVCVKLLSPKSEIVLSDTLSCSPLGSVNSDFKLDNLKLNGDYSLCVELQGRRIASCRVRIDESNLPDFDMQWDGKNRMLLPGDHISAAGQILCFSGRSPKDYKVELSLLQGSEKLESATLRSDSEGRFSYSFRPADKQQEEQQRFYWRYYSIQATITAPDGQTLSFSKNICVRPGLEMNLRLDNALKGEVRLKSSERAGCIKDNILTLSFFDPSLELRQSLRVNYSLLKGSTLIHSGRSGGESCGIDVKDLEDGLYTLKAEAVAMADNGKEYSRADSCKVLILKEGRSLPEEVEFWYSEMEPSKGSIAFGSGSGELWANVALHSEGNHLIQSRYVHLGKGEILCQNFEEELLAGKEGLGISLFFFKDAERHQYTKKIERPVERDELNLRFIRTTDITAPRQDCTFSVIADRDCELAVSVFDLASEKLMENIWSPIPKQERHFPPVPFSGVCGSHDSSFGYARPLMSSGIKYTVRASVAAKSLQDNFEMAVEEDSVESSAAPAEGQEEGQEVRIREDFSTTLFWAPEMELHKDRECVWSFRSSDKLSSFAVQLFAHDSQMNSAAVRNQMRVSIPVELSVSRPAYLYSSDIWTVTVALTNNSDASVQGNLSLKFTDALPGGGKTMMSKEKKRISIGAKESVSISFESRVPDCALLGVLASFSPTSKKERESFGGDALFFTVDVRERMRTIVESHSALVSESDRLPVQLDSLRASFSSTDPSKADISYISISEMLSKALPQSIEHRSDNSLDLCKELFARTILDKAAVSGSDPAAEKLLSCRNPDGGFAWFAGMDSSEQITALVLEMFGAFRPALSPAMEEALAPALRYLDRQFLLVKDIAPWRARLSLGQYLYVRSMFPEVEIEDECRKAMAKKEWKERVEEYLVPRSEAGLNGRILEKARRLLTLSNLSKDSASRLSSQLGLNSSSRLEKAARRDLESLAQYAVYNGQGEYYYPNAIMQRGLLESELYAHCLLCDLLERNGRKEIAEGIRMHLMLQKETQHWEDDFACLLALRTISRAEKQTLERKVVTLSSTETLPLDEVQAFGNGFSLECSYYKDGKRIEKGDVLEVGDRISAEYRIRSERSRSFVRFTAPRPACLECVDGRSRYCYPSAYREVKADRTEYWSELWPEETTVLKEEFHVVRAGEFSSEGLGIESVYAPHYRAGIPAEYQMISMPSETTQP